jgi:hypothetical protein
VRKLVWSLPLVGTAVAVWLVLGALRESTGTPREAVRLAIALCCSVLPYVAARALAELAAARSGGPRPPVAQLSRTAALLAAAASLLFATVATASYTTWSSAAVGGGRWLAVPVHELGGRPAASALVASDQAFDDGRGGSSRSVLAVGCALGNLSVSLGSSARVASKFGSSSVAIRIGLDDRPLEIATALTSGEGTVLTLPDAGSLLERLLEHRKLRVQFPVEQPGPGTATFDLAGLADHAARIQSACSAE